MVDQLDISLLCLAESQLDQSELANRVNANNEDEFKKTRLMTPKLTVLSRMSLPNFRLTFDVANTRAPFLTRCP